MPEMTKGGPGQAAFQSANPQANGSDVAQLVSTVNALLQQVAHLTQELEFVKAAVGMTTRQTPKGTVRYAADLSELESKDGELEDRLFEAETDLDYLTGRVRSLELGVVWA